MFSYAENEMKKPPINNSYQSRSNRPIIQKMDISNFYREKEAEYYKKNRKEIQTSKDGLEGYQENLEKEQNIPENGIASQLEDNQMVNNKNNILCVSQTQALTGGFLGHSQAFLEFNDGKNPMNYMIELRTAGNISGTSEGKSSLSTNSGSTSTKSCSDSTSKGTSTSAPFGNVVILVKPMLNLSKDKLGNNKENITITYEKAQNFINKAQEKQGKQIKYSLIHNSTNDTRMNCASFMQGIINESEILPDSKKIPNPWTCITPYGVVDAVRSIV